MSGKIRAVADPRAALDIHLVMRKCSRYNIVGFGKEEASSKDAMSRRPVEFA